MSFFKKLFGNSDNDKKSNPPSQEREGTQIISQLLNNYRKDKSSGIDVESGVKKLSDSFKSNFNIGLDELAMNEDKLINWLTKRNLMLRTFEKMLLKC